MVLMAVATIIWSFACLLSAPFPYAQRYWWTSRWNVFVIWAARVICGIRYEIRGAENLPDAPAILLSKHQSAWETIFYVINMPRPLVFVFKKELTYIPFFGWASALLRMIPIDRKKGRDAFSQVLEHGRAACAMGSGSSCSRKARAPRRLAGQVQGRRHAPGRGNQHPGGARGGELGRVLAQGQLRQEARPDHRLDRQADLAGRPQPQELNERVENWIESEMRVISPDVYKNSAPRPAAQAASSDAAGSDP
jgi:1-acyl-sn-glycerol-3-phosphate acyltransferase